MCFLQCHDDKLERYLTKRKQYFAKQKRYTSNCRNVVIEKSKNQKPKWKNQIGINEELIITDEYRLPEKTANAVFEESCEMCE